MSRPALVIDIETVPDRSRMAALGVPASAALGSSWLHRLAAVSLLQFVEAEDGAVADIDLWSGTAEADIGSDAGTAEEYALLIQIEIALRALGDTGLLVSFNGRRHDLPFLALRRRCHYRLAPSPLAPFLGREAARHCDVMEGLAADGLRWPSLAHACAALGIPHAQFVLPARTGAMPGVACKSETDVLATFLLQRLCTSEVRGTARLFFENWATLARWCIGTAAPQPHIAQFAVLPRAAMAAALSRPRG